MITPPRLTPPGGSEADGLPVGNDLIPRLFPSSQEIETISGITIGHFRIQKRIGIGGMGSVFLALDERLKRDVALKVLSPSLSLDQTSIQRFQNEAQAAARLDHDNIARVFYCGEENGLHYIAYEYVPGQNLRDVIRAKGWLDPPEAVNYAIQLTAALHHSSSAGVIHRDIKPSNVLITPFGRAKLVDLGLARKTSLETSMELTVPGTTMGTFDYISPEQARDPHSVDVRSDIYSLGCTLYHMLTGEPPYPEGTVLQKLLDHHAKDPPDPAKKNRRVSPMLSHVVRKMMASQPAHRYAIPADLLRDLLLVARSLGAGAVPIDGQVWLTATRFKPTFWQSNFGWVATTCALCLMVTAVQLFPGLAKWGTVPKKERGGSSASSTASSTKTFDPADSGTSTTNANKKEVTSRIEPPDNLPKPLTESSQFFGQNSNTDIGPVVPEPINSIAERLSGLSPDLGSKDDKTAASPGPAVAPIQIVNGKSYTSLEAACAEASDTGGITIIELRYNGLREPERPIRLTNKKVVIRAPDGFRPIVRFALPDSATDEGASQMIAVTGGSLELVNLNLLMSVPNRINSDRWALFSLERPEKVQLKSVGITIDNPQRKAACVFEQRNSAGPNLENIAVRTDGMPVVPPELVMNECLVRGSSDFIVMRDPVPARYELKECAVGVDGDLLQLRLVMDAYGIDRETITLELEHVTTRFGKSLLAVEGSGSPTEKLPKLFVFARNNILSCNNGYPLISMRMLPDSGELQKSFSWKGDLNFYDDIETFLDVTSAQPFSNRSLDQQAWMTWTSEGAGSSNQPVLWRQRRLEKLYSLLSSDDFALSDAAQPAVTGASSGTAAGANLATVKKLQLDR